METSVEFTLTEPMQALISSRGKKGICVYVNEDGVEVGNHGSPTLAESVAYASWDNKVWYCMLGVADAPWTLLCPLSAVVHFEEVK